MKSLKPWLLLALVFLVGIVFGVAGTRLAIRHAAREAALHPARAQLVIEKRLTRRLGLDADQQSKLDRILTDARAQLGALRQQYRPPVTLVFSNANAQISAILTLDQRLKYEKLKEENAPLVRGWQGE
jgi:uncharacterized membrane-anchored protein YhcB (DUF1043 family)